ncbi:hypothetical protein I3760_01G238500 [Carya illinoinensis]|nr:hypothetical protein I3760_01G238500 [Carya illinoinensis]
MAHSLREFALEFVKLDRFDGTNFRRWQKKMHFLLANLKVVYVLTTPRPSVNEDETIAQSRASIKLVQDDYICKGHICNTMSDTLFDAYQNKATAKDLWNTLEAKYLLEDAPSKTFLTTKFFNYNMINSRSVVEQFNVMMHILDQFSQHNMKMDEPISRKERPTNTNSPVNPNIKTERENNFERKQSHFQNENQKNLGVSCFHCGKQGNYKRECRFLKKKPHDFGFKDNFETMISETNTLEGDNSWLIDSGATRHVCKDKSLFKRYEPMEDTYVLYMGNSSTAVVKGKGTIKIEFTSGKKECCIW